MLGGILKRDGRTGHNLGVKWAPQTTETAKIPQNCQLFKRQPAGCAAAELAGVLLDVTVCECSLWAGGGFGVRYNLQNSRDEIFPPDRQMYTFMHVWMQTCA